MIDDRHGTPVRLDFPFEVSPSGGAVSLILDEERHAAFAVLIGYTPSLNAEDRREVVALVTVSGLVQAVFGYPNEEAVWKDPRGDRAGGIDEIAGSRWAQNIIESNRRSFGADYNWRAGRPPRHFFVGSKDATAQFRLTTSWSRCSWTRGTRRSSPKRYAVWTRKRRLGRAPSPPGQPLRSSPPALR